MLSGTQRTDDSVATGTLASEDHPGFSRGCFRDKKKPVSPLLDMLPVLVPVSPGTLGLSGRQHHEPKTILLAHPGENG